MASVNQALVPFIHNEIQLKEACWIGDEPYFTRRAVGEWLGYRNPQKKIDEIIRKNPHIKQFSVTPRLGATDGKEYETEVYNPIGLQLIVFESHQPKAKAFKIAVAHLVYAYMKGELKAPRDIERHRLYLQIREIVKLAPYYERATAIRYLSEKAGRSRATIYRWVQRVDGGGDLQRKPGWPRHGIDPQEVETIGQWIEENPRLTLNEIRSRRPEAGYSARWLRNQKRRVKEQIKQRVIARLEAAVG